MENASLQPLEGETAPGEAKRAAEKPLARPEQPSGAAEAASSVNAAPRTGEASSSRKARVFDAGEASVAQPRGTKSLGPADRERPAVLTTRLTEPSAKATPDYQLPPSIQLSRYLYSEKSFADSQPQTPTSNADTALVSEISTGTVVVTEAHQSKISLSLTASIEDYAKKADPANWAKPLFRKSQFVRIQPGT